MLGGALEQNGAEAGDEAVDHKGDDRAADHRENEIGPLQDRLEQRQEKLAAEISGRVSSDDGGAAHQLTRQTKPVSANDLKQKQDDREGKEDNLPKR